MSIARKINLPSRGISIWGLFTILALLLRFPSFFRSVINHDESTYIVVSNMMLAGYTYWVDVIDTKPIGIMLIYSLMHLAGLGKIAFFRLVCTLVLASTAFLLYRLVRAMGGNSCAGWAAGTMYLLMTSIFTFFGVSPNTEVYFNLFTAASFFIMLSGRHPMRGPLAGLLAGLGFMIKYVVLFDVLALGLWLLWEVIRGERPWKSTFVNLTGMALGMAVPFLSTWAWYELQGHGEVFRFYTFELSGRYLIKPQPFAYFNSLLDFSFRYIPILFFAAYAMASRRTKRKPKSLALIWGAFALTAVLFPGRFYAHYYIQFMLPLCFAAGFFFDLDRDLLPNGLQWSQKRKVWWALLAIFIPVNMLLMKKDYIDPPDVPRLVAAAVLQDYNPKDGFYMGNTGFEIIYFLLDTPAPIRYVHGSLIGHNYNLEAMKIDRDAEIEKIFSKPPRYMLTMGNNNLTLRRATERLEGDYCPVPIPGLPEGDPHILWEYQLHAQ